MCALPGLYFKMFFWCILCNGHITQLIATGLQYRLIEVFVLAKLLSVSYCTCNLSNFLCHLQLWQLCFSIACKLAIEVYLDQY